MLWAKLQAEQVLEAGRGCCWACDGHLPAMAIQLVVLVVAFQLECLVVELVVAAFALFVII